MRYFNFLVKRTISKFLQNSALRKTGGGITKVIGGIFGILLTPTAMMIGAGAIGLYMAYTLFGSLSSSMMNITTSSPLSTTMNTGIMSNMLGLFPLLIVAVFLIATISSLMSVLRVPYGGAM